jgi:hypothetical protein
MLLYSSDQFIVVYEPFQRDGQTVDAFTVASKEAGTQVYLHGQQADHLQFQLRYWERVHPSEEAVDSFLEGYVALGVYPLVTH